MSIITVVERDYAIADPDSRDRYIGCPCRTYEEARELCFAHMGRHTELIATEYVNNGVVYAEVSTKTGEIVKEFFVNQVA